MFVALYAVVLTAAVALILLMVSGRLPKNQAYAWTLCAACLLIGPVASSAASSDWSPLGLIALNTPFLLVAIAAGLFGARWRRGSHT